jgi:hypothetical protein
MNQISAKQHLNAQPQGDQQLLPFPPQLPSVAHRCSSCGAEMRPHESFCPNCGARLAPVPQLPVQNPSVEARTQQAAEPTQFATPGGQGIPSLEIQSSLHGGKSTYDLTKPIINIGRDPSNDIVIDAQVVSHFHAQIVREGNQLLLIHPHPSQSHTTNGLLYQGRHILGNEPFRKPLVRGDIFRIGNGHGALVTLTYNDGSEATQAIAPEIRPLPVGAPVSAPGSQSPHPQVQPPRSGKFRYRSSKEKATIIVAIITAIATVMAAIISGVFLMMANGLNKPHNPIATSSSMLTPSPSPSYPPSGWNLVLNDPMQSNSTGYWPVTTDKNRSCQFTNGAYQVSTTSILGSRCSLQTNSDFTDFAFEIQLRIVKGDEGGIFFRADANDANFYSFWISSDGNYGLEIWQNLSFSKSLVSSNNAAINPGLNQFNKIAVVAQGNTFHLYVNEQLIKVVTDYASSYSHGNIDIEAQPTSNPTQVLFSNVKVWTPPLS